MIKLRIYREPLRSYDGHSNKDSFESTFSVDHDDELRPSRLGFSFIVDPNGQHGSRFSLRILPGNFVEFARMMVEADPVEAVRAFGAAVQEAAIERKRLT